MRSYVTSFNGLFSHRTPDAPAVERIEIPLIQRDYAQGRSGVAVQRVRDSFLRVLHTSLTGGEPLSLDFVYGDVENGTLRPLDGQQRLTTLFLLHWYLAFRAARLGGDHGWKHFSYTTRPSARLFCERLTRCEPPLSKDGIVSWITDQPWYLHTWRHDPTIQSMLVMLGALEQLFRDDDCVAAWERLVDPERPAISFHVLPIEKMGLSEDLYIKMNSRGKPLTPFENFKARFEQLLETSCPSRVADVAGKLDGDWSDLLWPYRGDDNIVDDEFLRYFHFVTEVCGWREGRQSVGDMTSLAEATYGPGNATASANVDFLCQALDAWVGTDIASGFAALFATGSPDNTEDASKVVLFGPQGTDLFEACCRHYGATQGRNRIFSLPRTLLLYGVVLHRIHQTTGFPKQLRLLRNLVEASDSEIRVENMPALLADVERIVVGATLEGVTTFNQAQVADELLKASFLARSPELEGAVAKLENHSILRGCLVAFELDAAEFERRAATFHKLLANDANLASLTGALLATGDYSRFVNNRAHQFGSRSNQSAWRATLTGTSRTNLTPTRAVLGRLLDAVAATDSPIEDTLATITERWLATAAASEGFDWRWYFVRYPEMRSGASGLYFGSKGTLGYSVCMLQKSQLNSNYRDPFLLAIHRESGVGAAVKDPWFTGWSTDPRWMRLERSGTEMRCIDEGLALRAPSSAAHKESFTRACENHGVTDAQLLAIPQAERDGRRLDTRDRVQLGAALLRDLVSAGL